MRSDTSVPRLVPSRSVDPATGSASVDYYWDDELSPKVKLTGKIVDRYSGYSLIKKDLDNALRWITKVEDLAKNFHQDDARYVAATDRELFDNIKAFFVAGLTFYGKCFTQTAGRSAGASRDWLDVEHRQLHDLYMKYRHNFAAHSGDEKLEEATTFVLLNPSSGEVLPHLPTIRIQPDVVMSGLGEKSFSDLIRYVGEKTAEKYDKTSERIFEILYDQTPQYWADAAQAKVSINLDQFMKTKPKAE